MRLGLYSACVPSLTPEQAIASSMETGYAGIEWRVSNDVGDGRAPHFLHNNRCTVRDVDTEIDRICALTRAAGLEVLALAPYVETGDIAAVERMVAAAQRNGVPAVRLRAPWMGPKGFHPLFASGREFFDRVADLAALHRVKALLEMHQRSICPSASLAKQLVGHLPPENVGVIYDVGNLVVEGYEDHELALQILGPHLAHVHLKNAAYFPHPGGGPWKHAWTEIDNGIADIPRVLDLLAARGYEGWVSVEDFSNTRDDPAKLRYDAAYLHSHPQVTATALPMAP